MLKICACILTLFVVGSCNKNGIKIIPDSVHTHSSMQKISFRTDKPFDMMVVWTPNDSPKPAMTFEEGFQVIKGDWYSLKGQLYSNEIELYLDNNGGGKRYLIFSVIRGSDRDDARVIQDGGIALK